MTNRIFPTPRCDRCDTRVVLGVLCARCKQEIADAIHARLNQGDDSQEGGAA